MKNKTITKEQATALRRDEALKKLNQKDLNTVKLAEFMGYKLAICSNGLAWESPYRLAVDDHFKIHGMLLESSIAKFNFNTSLDYLMPVIKKCHDLDRAKLKEFISYTDFATGNIEACLNGVIGFIMYRLENK